MLNYTKKVFSSNLYTDVVNGLQFASDHSYYQKLFSFPRRNYTYWSAGCDGKFFFSHFIIEAKYCMKL